MHVVIGIFALIVVLIVGGNILTTKDKTVVTPDENACGCDDVKLILDRQTQVEAAVDSINRQLKTLDPKVMYSNELYAAGRGVNKARVENASEGLESTGGGADTHWLDCKPDVSKGRTACMRAALQAHENVHQRECLASGSRFRNYKTAKTMVEFWQEDLEGYQAEMDYLKRNLGTAMGKCPVTNYPSAKSKDEQQQRLAGSKRRVTQYVAGLS